MDAKLPYWAGFFDGEGCVTISRTYSKNKRPSYTLTVQIGNTHLGVLEEIKERYGGGIYTRKGVEGRTRMYDINLRSKVAEAFISDILPFLVVKKKEAELALEFRNLAVRSVYSNRPLTEDEIQIREDFKLRLAQLKSRDQE